MKKYIFISICIFATFLCENTYADTIDSPQDFKTYKENANNFCSSSNHPWNNDNALLPIPQYAELSADAVNSQIVRTQNLSNLSDSEKTRLQYELDTKRIGDFSGFKAVEVARLQYRSTMDSIFACGVVESRLNILEKLQNEIGKYSTNRQSEIQKQLEKEKERLSRERDKLKCNKSEEPNADIMNSVVNSATHQYCHYRYYLQYLDSNLEHNRAHIESIESAIWVGNGTHRAENIWGWVASYNIYANSLSQEIRRADTTLPRAITAFKDMERVYPMHLMLTIIYDDFIRLRQNLSAYMNASTQLYLKAYNAQDANKR